MTKRRLKIWITRVQPAADVTAERVRAMGHDAVVVPLLEVQVLPDVDVDLRGVAGGGPTVSPAPTVSGPLPTKAGSGV